MLLNEDGLRKKLKSETPHGLYCVFGEDTYLKDFYLDKIVNAAVDPALAAFNKRVFTRDERELLDIYEAIDALPMMSEYQCVLVRDYPLYDLKKDDFEEFSQVMAKVPETTLLIFFFGDPEIEYNPRKPDKWTKYFDLFNKYGTLVNLSHRTQSAIVKTLVNGAKDRGTSIDPDTAQYLVERAGTDLQTLLNEFNKLCAYADGTPVSREMVDECVQQSVEASVFDICHALLSGNADRAFEILHELLRRRVDAQTLVGGMAFNWIDLYRAKCASLEDKRMTDYAESYNYHKKPSSALQTVMLDAKKIKRRQIVQALDILAETDAQLKSRSVNGALLLEETLVRLAGVCRQDA